MMKKQILIIIHQMAMAGLIIPNIMHIGLLTKRFCVNLGGDSSPISYHYRVVLLSGHLHLLC